MKAKNTEIESVGKSLIEHVQDAAASRHGIVEELFPYIVQASKKISARAIARFLEDQHDVKISYVTIGRALRNPQKYWNLYFDSIEQSAWIVAESHEKKLKEFISEPDKYQEMLETKPVLIFDDNNNPGESHFRAEIEYNNAVATLDEKWFCFDEDILEESRMYLSKRFAEKPAPQNDDTEN